jgi:hypothetical protein
MDEPSGKNPPAEAPSDATVVVQRDSDATSTRTIGAQPGSAPPVAPAAAPPVSTRPNADAPPTDDATHTAARVAMPPPRVPPAPPPPPPTPAMPPAHEETVLGSARGTIVAPPAPPGPPRVPPPASPPGADAATRTMAAPPRPPRVDATDARPAPAPPRAPVAAPTAPPPRGSTAPPDDVTTLSRAADLPDDATVFQRPPVGRPRLVIRNPDGSTREVPLTNADVSIGRAKTSDVILPSSDVSRLHARVVLRGANHVLIPVGTHRNTFVNGELVLDERLLAHGDVIRLASDEVVYAEKEHLAPAQSSGTGRSNASVLLYAAIGGIAAFAAAAVLWIGWGDRLVRHSNVGTYPPPDRRAPDVAPAPPPAAPERQPAIVADAPAAPGPPAVAPAPPPAGAAPPADQNADQVRKLVYQGDIAFLERKYTTPPDASALFAYTEALKLDPRNARALAQIALIVDRYLELADRALAANDRSNARLYADKAAYVHEQAAEAGDRGDIERRLDALNKRLAGARR